MSLLGKILKGKATLVDQKKALQDPYIAYIEKCQDAACKNPERAFNFAYWIKGANIEKCQEAACRDPKWAFCFAYDIPGADIEKCQEAVCKDSHYAYMFAVYIKEADLAKIQQLCPEISGKINEIIMDRVLM